MTSSVSSSPDSVRSLQEKAARALPAEHLEHLHGWWLRHSTGCTWWAATVLPHADGERDDLARRIAAAETFYAGHGALARFQISPGACPEILDTLLAERGYRRESPVSLQVCETRQVVQRASGHPLRVRLDYEPTSKWFGAWQAAQGHSGDRRDEWDMLVRVQRPSAYASAILGDDVVAVGRAVADEGWAGVFGMATLPHARGRHAGRSVLAALAEWAAAHDADRLYLQVACDNTAALRLYTGMGFCEVCVYHYRTASSNHDGWG